MLTVGREFAEIVRCSKCKHMRMENDICMCDFHNNETKLGNFCSAGVLAIPDDYILVTRCADCKYYRVNRPFNLEMTTCTYEEYHPVWTEPNGYCHHAKRRTETNV